ncbi:serine hydroxymethyltransferase [Streptomyces canus]|jgi:glycine hydroxymethyltransferase|uniref:serine hydroxymethyltransferase n=1 Tax=Streptomyces canus TaxID=58343 RepID=UPI0037233246
MITGQAPLTTPRSAPQPSTTDGTHRQLLDQGTGTLPYDDPALAGLLDAEVRFQQDNLAMVAYASLAHPSVLAAAGSALSNVTAEGYPGARYHPGAHVFDEVERLAARRAAALFGARHANVQPHSCSSANLSVLFALMRPGDTLLGLDLDAGGHLTHGASASVTGRYFRAVRYGLGPDGRIDLDEVAALARRHRPKVIVAGASAYPRTWEYEAFRAVADEVGAWLLADISHVAGLVAAGLHPNPVDIAHVTTTSTYKQLGGPRGGLILLGAAADEQTDGHGGAPLAERMRRGVFPRTQGTPNAAAIAAKARALGLAARPQFTALARRIKTDARALAEALVTRGHRLVSGGTDNHLLLLDLSAGGVSGADLERALEECGILANRNRVPGDTRPPLVTSGLRLGTNILAQRGLGPTEMDTCADLVDTVARGLGAGGGRNRLDPVLATRVRAAVRELCDRFPVPLYPAAR